MSVIASGASQKLIIGCMRRPNITGGRADKQQTRGSNCTKHASIAGHTHTDGGMKTDVVGIQTATGMNTTMTGTTATSPRI